MGILQQTVLQDLPAGRQGAGYRLRSKFFAIFEV